MTNTFGNKESLKNYISVVYEGEKEKYRLEQVISTTKKEIEYLKGLPVLQKPTKGKLEEIKDFVVVARVIGIAMIIYEFFSGMMHQPFLMILAMYAMGIWLIRWSLKAADHNFSAEKNNKFVNEQYERELAAYNKNVKEVAARKLLVDTLQEKIGKTQSILAGVNRELKKAYSYDVIYPTYRNLIAISSFYDYLYSGRCDTLEGHEGAYNIYGNESRLDKIITRLDDIKYKLDSIRYNQHSLYRAMEGTKSLIGNLESSLASATSQLGKISQETSITNSRLNNMACSVELMRFNAEEARKEIELRNRVDGISRNYYL